MASGSGDQQLFRFAQLEFPWELGPPDGRYVVRGHAGEVDHVVVTQTLGAPQRRGLVRNRRAQPVAPEPQATPVPVTRVTVVDAVPFPNSVAAERWRNDANEEDEVRTAVTVLNRMIHLFRTATADPFVHEVAREQAVVARVGIGEGEQLAHSRWQDAIELPPPKPRDRGSAALRPQERLAALMGGRDVALACEELILRARIDQEAGRTREMTLQLRIALEAAIAELAPWADQPGLPERLDRLRAERKAVGAAANRALEGGLDTATIADVERVIGLVESALRARSAIGFA